MFFHGGGERPCPPHEAVTPEVQVQSYRWHGFIRLRGLSCVRKDPHDLRNAWKSWPAHIPAQLSSGASRSRATGKYVTEFTNRSTEGIGIFRYTGIARTRGCNLPLSTTDHRLFIKGISVNAAPLCAYGVAVTQPRWGCSRLAHMPQGSSFLATPV